MRECRRQSCPARREVMAGRHLDGEHSQDRGVAGTPCDKGGSKDNRCLSHRNRNVLSLSTVGFMRLLTLAELSRSPHNHRKKRLIKDDVGLLD
jgi:hypothetical protein